MSTESEQRIVVPGLRLCALEEDYISGNLDFFCQNRTCQFSCTVLMLTLPNGK